MKKNTGRGKGCLIHALITFVIVFLGAFALYSLLKDSNISTSLEQRESETQKEETANMGEKTKTTTKKSEDEGDLKVSKVIVSQYKKSLDEYPRFAFYFSYKNTGSETLEVTDFRIAVTNKANGKALKQGENSSDLVFAPKILKPGQTGYAAMMNLSVPKEDLAEGIEVKANGEFEEASNERDQLKCSEIKKLHEGYINSTIEDDTTLSVKVENESEEETEKEDVLIGILDRENKIIGVAFTVGNGVPAEKAVRVDCDNVVFENGKSFGDAYKFRAYAGVSP